MFPLRSEGTILCPYLSTNQTLTLNQVQWVGCHILVLVKHVQIINYKQIHSQTSYLYLPSCLLFSAIYFPCSFLLSLSSPFSFSCSCLSFRLISSHLCISSKEVFACKGKYNRVILSHHHPEHNHHNYNHHNDQNHNHNNHDYNYNYIYQRHSSYFGQVPFPVCVTRSRTFCRTPEGCDARIILKGLVISRF